MDIIRHNEPIKQFRQSELEEIWLRILVHACVPNGHTDFNFFDDIMIHLPYPGFSPYERLLKIGVTSSTLTDILVTAGVGFHHRLITNFADTVFYLHGRMDEVSVWDLETLSFTGPLMSRMFHHWVRPPGDPVREGTALLNRRAKNWFRSQGFYLPPRLNRHAYRQYEQSYIWLQNNQNY